MLFGIVQFLSTPSARRATGRVKDDIKPNQISIHALCEEGDVRHRRHSTHRCISIHALCEEGDSRYPGVMRKFHYFYPRPLRGGRPGLGDKWFKDNQISIHALCEEGDL